MPPPTGLVINAGVTVNAGVTLNGFASSGGNSIDASTLTVNNGIQIYLANSLFFYVQAKADEFYAANPTVFYYVHFDGTQTKFDGCTLGAVTQSGPYWGVAPSGGTITTGTYLTNATNSRIYYAPPAPITYTGWPTEFYYQGVYLTSSTNLQINNETNAAALWAVYYTLTPGTPISFIINNTPYYTTIADPARGGGGMIAPYISIVATTVLSGIVSSVTIG